jgi:hypothetical protein
MTDLMVAPPKPGDVSFPLYNQEVTGIFSSLKRRAAKVHSAAPASTHARACDLTLVVARRRAQLHEERVVHQPGRRHVRTSTMPHPPLVASAAPPVLAFISAVLSPLFRVQLHCFVFCAVLNWVVFFFVLSNCGIATGTRSPRSSCRPLPSTLPRLLEKSLALGMSGALWLVLTYTRTFPLPLSPHLCNMPQIKRARII